MFLSVSRATLKRISSADQKRQGQDGEKELHRKRKTEEKIEDRSRQIEERITQERGYSFEAKCRTLS